MKSIASSLGYVVGLMLWITIAAFCVYGFIFAVMKTNQLLTKPAYYSTLDVQINTLNEKYNTLVNDLTHSGILPIAKEGGE